MINVLMIEDDTEFAEILSEYLAKYNIKITNFEDPYLGLSAGVKKYDLLILDLTLPGMDGLEVCKEIVAQYDIPIIISSARSDISDKVIGLQIGADDYLPKPYDPKEMYARIQSLIRRYKKKLNVRRTAKSQCFLVDEKRHEISFKGEVLNLTPAEYEILSYMIRQNGFSISREQLVYNCKSLKDKGSKSLDVIIGRLRTKIGDDSKSPEYIHSVRGIGYKLVG
ncbi:Sensory transduction protein regX3 [Sulfurospirillum diekertiae]|uniref:Sensory transduction protein regX3 n=1 Tax=Sulfurospirillum diekertiae TaxID=1854492 RepID=A0A1Y0HKK0_9BACT|nr:response regulator transcription factor [Sulfurospirillum diekertiae]ARU47855.1 Sensory transduction protein regX3 [Sulfurospirillum diekertiae]